MKVWLDGVTLQVEDVERSREYYQQLPGAELEYHRPGEFALVRLGAARLGLLGVGPTGFHLEIATDELDRLYEQLSDAGIETLGPPEDRSWGERTFHVIDPDGNHVEFGQE